MDDTLRDKFREARRRLEELREAFRAEPPELGQETVDAMREAIRRADEFERRHPELLRGATAGH